MSASLRLILGLSLLVTAVGCDDGGNTGEEPSGPKPVGGAGNSGGNPVLPGMSGTGSGLPTGGTGGSDSGSGGSGASTGGSGASTGGGGADTGGSSTTGGTGSVEGVPLTSTDGWVDAGSNVLGVQGAMFAFFDATSGMGITQDFLGPNACISGTAAKVDMKCTPVAPAADCYGTYWGAAIGLNLNQPIDPDTGLGSATAMPFDASALTGFAFEITGTKVPTSLRFKIEDATGEYCTPTTKPVKLGINKFLFTDLIAECWKPTTTAKTADSAKAGLVKIAWQVVTNAVSTIPFDYCVANVVALQ